jgi:hypothetical protein
MEWQNYYFQGDSYVLIKSLRPINIIIGRLSEVYFTNLQPLNKS